MLLSLAKKRERERERERKQYIQKFTTSKQNRKQQRILAPALQSQWL